MMMRDDVNWRFDFGKYKYMTIKEVYEADPKYIECLENDRVLMLWGPARKLIEGSAVAVKIEPLPDNVITMDELRLDRFLADPNARFSD